MDEEEADLPECFLPLSGLRAEAARMRGGRGCLLSCRPGRGVRLSNSSSELVFTTGMLPGSLSCGPRTGSRDPPRPRNTPGLLSARFRFWLNTPVSLGLAALLWSARLVARLAVGRPAGGGIIAGTGVRRGGCGVTRV